MKAALLKQVSNLVDEFGAGNLVVLAFNNPDMDDLRRRSKGEIGKFIRARIKGKANR